MDSDQFGDVIDRIYEAAARPELWCPVLTEMAQATGSQGVRMMHHRPEGASLHASSEGLDEMLKALFAEGWNRNNPREVRARQRGFRTDEVITERDLFEPGELEREPWQRDFLDRFDLKWFATFALRPVMEDAPFLLTMERRANTDAFNETEISMITAMVPHVQRAVRMSVSFGAAAQSGMMDALTTMRKPTVLLNDLGQIIRMNADAEKEMGNGITVRQGQLRASDRDADEALQRLLNSVCWAGAAFKAPAIDAVALPRGKGRPLIVQAAPLVNTARDLFQQARALVLFNVIDNAPEPDGNLLRYAFKLTPAEARVAQLIATGHGPTSIAGALGVSPTTVKTHLNAIFIKTETHTQTALAVVLSRVAGRMEADPPSSARSSKEAAALQFGRGAELGR